MGTSMVQGRGQQPIQLERHIQHNFSVQILSPKDEKLNIKRLVERSTGIHYILKKLYTNSQDEAALFNQIIVLKIKNNCQSVTPLQEHYSQRIKGTCNTQITYYLLFKIDKFTSLRTQLMKRCLTGEKFSQEQLIQGIKNCGKAISWERSVYGQPNSQANWDICAQNIYYYSGAFCLSDPWISQFQPNQNFKYYSPQRLELMNDEIQEIDWGASQMFSIVMAFLQAAKLGKMRKIYQRNKIHFHALFQEIQQCKYPNLKELLKQLLLKGPQQRRQFLNGLQDGGQRKEKQKITRFQKQKITRFQKYKMLNKVHNTKKLKLIKQTNNLDLNITAPQQKKQNKTETLITNNQKLPLQAHNTNRLPQIRFNYIPFLNKVRLDLHPIDKEIKYVHECIQNINKNLANIQTFVQVSQKIYSQESKSMPQNVAQSKIVQETSSKQEQLKEINKISLKQCFKVEMPQTHTEESQAKMSKELIEKDSLHVLMEQFRAEEQNRLTQSYSQAKYTVNINQAKAETLDPIYKVQKEESSLEIVNFPFDDTNGYIFKMQGTQLQAVSKLTIPQQQPQEQQSFQQGVQKVSKGQYVEQKHQKGGIYKGFMQNNKRNGLGTFIYLQGGYYEGNWKDNKMNGYGKIYYDSGVLAYEGLWYQDQIHGRGKLFNDSPQTMEEPFNYKNFQHQAYHIYQLSYEGDFSHDLKQGFGKLILSNGESYSGQFHQNDPHGKGFFNGLNCSVYGQWQNGKFIKTL